MNDLFDVMNSRSSKGIKLQGLLRESNKQYWLPFFVKAHMYIYGLRNGNTGARMVTDKLYFLCIINKIIFVVIVF